MPRAGPGKGVRFIDDVRLPLEVNTKGHSSSNSNWVEDISGRSSESLVNENPGALNEGVGPGPIAEVAGLTSDVNVGISDGPIYLIMGPNGVKDIAGSMVAKSIKKGGRKGKRRFGWKIPFSLFKKKNAAHSTDTLMKYHMIFKMWYLNMVAKVLE